jgi:hypothetical protein
MRQLRVISAAAALLALVTASAASTGTPRGEISAADFDRAKFSRSTTVDNRWLPLKPGTQLVFQGTTSEGKERIPHRLIFTVTDLTKVIGGVRTVVLWDRDFSAGQLVEAELAFFAQDDGGNVWQLGEYPEEYEDGKVVATPAWFHGIKGARAGITQKAEPRLGTPSYSLGWGPAVGFNDRGKVLKMGEKTCVPLRCYTNVLVVDEFNPDEPGKSQLKYYAPGVGNVRVGWAGAKEESKETLVLVKIVHLSAEGLARVRKKAQKLEEHAYQISKQVYGRTPPMEQRSSP